MSSTFKKCFKKMSDSFILTFYTWFSFEFVLFWTVDQFYIHTITFGGTVIMVLSFCNLWMDAGVIYMEQPRKHQYNIFKRILSPL